MSLQQTGFSYGEGNSSRAMNEEETTARQHKQEWLLLYPEPLLNHQAERKLFAKGARLT